MLKEAVLALVACAMPAKQAEQPSMVSTANDVMDIVQAEDEATLGALDGLGVVWIPCGEVNGMYDPNTDMILMCLEDATDPGFTRFIAAHETGHALVDALDLPMDEGPVASEVAADELGALMLIDQGRQADIQAAALATLTQEDPPEGDVHPKSQERAYHLMCLEDGSEDHPATLWCKTLYDQVRAKWTAALTDAIEHRLASPPPDIGD